MRYVRLVVEYDGADLAGWQRQANGPTVQQHLEDALARMLGHPVIVLGASRTDAGVHARGQVCAFKTPRPIPLDGIRRGLNALLPPEIAIVDAQEAPDEFHPRFSATGKHYRYAILNRADRSPLLHQRAWHRPRALDLDAMRAAAASLQGEHDFSAFRAAGCTARTTVRRIDRIDVSRDGDLVHLDVRGNAFLRHMVRILSGTLIEVGEGRREITEVREILEGRDRTRAGQTAPPYGLTLIAVEYA